MEINGAFIESDVPTGSLRMFHFLGNRRTLVWMCGLVSGRANVSYWPHFCLSLRLKVSLPIGTLPPIPFTYQPPGGDILYGVIFFTPA